MIQEFQFCRIEFLTWYDNTKFHCCWSLNNKVTDEGRFHPLPWPCHNLKSQALLGLRKLNNKFLHLLLKKMLVSFPAETTGHIPPPGPPCNI